MHMHEFTQCPKQSACVARLFPTSINMFSCKYRAWTPSVWTILIGYIVNPIQSNLITQQLQDPPLSSEEKAVKDKDAPKHLDADLVTIPKEDVSIQVVGSQVGLHVHACVCFVHEHGCVINIMVIHVPFSSHPMHVHVYPWAACGRFGKLHDEHGEETGIHRKNDAEIGTIIWSSSQEVFWLQMVCCLCLCTS